MSEPTQPWWTGDDDIGGIGFARLFAYGGLVLGLGSFALAIAAPLQGDALRTVWVTGFGAAAMWVAFMAVPRYRRAGVRVSWAVPAAMVLGVLTIAIMVYAFVVIAAASAGVELPAPSHWLPPASSAPGVDA
jgi:hypothetical protein